MSGQAVPELLQQRATAIALSQPSPETLWKATNRPQNSSSQMPLEPEPLCWFEGQARTTTCGDLALQQVRRRISDHLRRQRDQPQAHPNPHNA